MLVLALYSVSDRWANDYGYWQGKHKYSEHIMQSARFSTSNRTWFVLRKNFELGGGRQPSVAKCKDLLYVTLSIFTRVLSGKMLRHKNICLLIWRGAKIKIKILNSLLGPEKKSMLIHISKKSNYICMCQLNTGNNCFGYWLF